MEGYALSRYLNIQGFDLKAVLVFLGFIFFITMLSIYIIMKKQMLRDGKWQAPAHRTSLQYNQEWNSFLPSPESYQLEGCFPLLPLSHISSNQ